MPFFAKPKANKIDNIVHPDELSVQLMFAILIRIKRTDVPSEAELKSMRMTWYGWHSRGRRGHKSKD